MMIRLSDPKVIKRLGRNFRIVTWLNRDIESVKAELFLTDCPIEKQRFRFKIISLLRAIKIIRDYPHRIKHVSQIAGLPHIGKGVVRRVSEILETGHLNNTDLDSERFRIIKDLMKVHGIGEQTAKRLIDQDHIDNLDSLKKSAPTLGYLSKATVIALDYQTVILNRSQVREIFREIQALVYSIYPKSELILCGSYRRGKRHISDLDILIVEFGLESLGYRLVDIVSILTRNKLLIADLCGPDNTRYMGIGRWTDLDFRIDLRILPYSAKASGLLYFTGSAEYNRLLRQDAKRRGYSLSEYGINVLGETLTFPTEQAIVEFLGFDYLPPHERNI